MTYSETVRYLYSLGNEVKTAKLGLERISVLLRALGDPHRFGAFVHVAGTNGKGSTSAMIESALRAAGLRTGLYSSPHLVEPTERIRIAGADVPRENFVRSFQAVHTAAEGLLAEGAIDLHPTYFETVTAMAFVLFREAGVDITVLEVGLGGRLDATNVVLPRLAVITPIDFDHEAFLGRSLDSIAREKGGILKPGVPAVLAAQRPEAEAALLECAHASASPVHRSAAWTADDLSIDAYGSRFTAAGRRRYPVECPLAGVHQVDNALTAVAALDALDIEPEAVRAGIRSVRWPGRLEFVRRRPDVILDGAHNPAGARALAAYLARFHSGRTIRLIYGAMRDKAVAEMAAILFPLAAEVIAAAPAQARAVRPELILDFAENVSIRPAAHIGDALDIALRGAPDDLVVITGSLFLVGEARALLVQ